MLTPGQEQEFSRLIDRSLTGWMTPDESSRLRALKILRDGYLVAPGEPGNCPDCGARRQYNLDGDVIHARAGSAECPPVPFSEGPVQALLRLLQENTGNGL